MIEKIDIKQFQPNIIDEGGVATWDTGQARLKMIAEKINEIIEEWEHYKTSKGINLIKD